MIYENIKNQSNMKNLKVLFTVLCAACATAVWGESIEINTSNSGVQGSYADNTFTISNVQFGYTQWMKNTNIQAKKSTTNSCYNVDAIPGTITKITVVQTGTARAITMYGGTATKPTTKINPPSTAATMVFDFSGKGYTFFSLSTPSNACYFNTITIEYESSGSGETTKYFNVSFVDKVQGTNCSSFDMTNVAENTQIVFNSIDDKPQATTGTCEQTHYHFVGWIEDGETPNETGSNVIAAGTTSIKATKDVTYKAVWAQEAN